MTISRTPGLDLMRKPFAANQISRLPKPTKAQNEAVKRNYKVGVRCAECGGWHHPNVVHLDYVGHAALTDRLLDCDLEWNWEPVATDDVGRPILDQNGGMWIRLTVDGVTRLGYGHPDGKTGGDAIKEVIGDALRNAAMRFGAALDLWHKGELHVDDEADAAEDMPVERPQPQLVMPPAPNDPAAPAFDPASEGKRIIAAIAAATNMAELEALMEREASTLPNFSAAARDKIKRTAAARAGIIGIDDEIPY